MGFSMRPAQKDDCRPEEKRRRTKGQLAVATAHLVLSLGLFVGGGLLLAAGVYSMTHLLGTEPGAVPARSPHCRQPSPHRQPPLAAPHATEPPARPMHLLLVLGAASLVVVALSVPMHSGRPKRPWASLYQALLISSPVPPVRTMTLRVGRPKKPGAYLSHCLYQVLLLLATAAVAALLAAAFVTLQAVSGARGASGGGFALASLDPPQQERELVRVRVKGSASLGPTPEPKPPNPSSPPAPSSTTTTTTKP